MGAVSDLVNMGDTGRMRSPGCSPSRSACWVSRSSNIGGMSMSTTRSRHTVPAAFIWAENILGGLLFGIGMTLASGCGNKTLIRIGGGNLKSIVVFA